jgi:integrase
MPKTITFITDAEIKSLKPRERAYYIAIPDCPGLALRVAPSGKKTWSARYRIGRRQRRWTIGQYPKTTLSQAREAVNNRKDGEDPQAAKKAHREADTFKDFAATYIEKHAKPKKRTWKSDKMQLDTYVLPEWKHRLVCDITRRDVRELLDSIAARPAPIVANRVRSLLHKLFNVAIILEVVEHNPVTKTAKLAEEHARDRFLTHDEIQIFWEKSETLPQEMRAAWQIRLLTAQRGGEVYGMRWQDIDLNTGWWTIPATAAKNKKAHRVPLSQPVLDLLTPLKAKADEALKKHPKSPHAVYVLRNARGKRQQAQAAAIFSIKDFRGHDLRRTAASLMASSGVPRLTISKILNHTDSSVTAIYDRHSYDAEKRTALDNWARQLRTIVEEQNGGAVLPFAARA